MCYNFFDNNKKNAYRRHSGGIQVEDLSFLNDDQFTVLSQHVVGEDTNCPKHVYEVRVREAWTVIELFYYEDTTPRMIIISYDVPPKVDAYSFAAVRFERLLTKKCIELQQRLKQDPALRVELEVYHVPFTLGLVRSYVNKFWRIRYHQKWIKKSANV